MIKQQHTSVYEEGDVRQFAKADILSLRFPSDSASLLTFQKSAPQEDGNELSGG